MPGCTPSLKPHKYRVSAASERQADGITFDSKKERNRYLALKVAKDAGAVVTFPIYWFVAVPAALRPKLIAKLRRRSTAPSCMSSKSERRSVDTTRPAICFVALNAYPVLAGRKDLGHIGGAEIQQQTIGRELQRRGYRVSFITLDHGQPDGIDCDGIRVFKAYDRSTGLPGLRFLHPRWTGLGRAAKRAEADIYYQRAAGVETGRIAHWCGANGRRFVYAVAGDPDCQRNLWRLSKRRERWLYKFGLTHADALVAQTAAQQRLLRSEFQLDSVLIRTCSVEPEPTPAVSASDNGGPRLLWLGRVTRQKGLDHLLDLAERCPEFEFDMVGVANTDSDYARRVLQRADSLPNVELHGYVPHAEVDEYYRHASAVLCTSDWEGFPNTFVEAWSRGIPVVTRWDADAIVEANGLGVADAATAAPQKAAA